MNTRDLEAFLAVVEIGSIIGASARLHVTQPGVSRRIQALEASVGVELLDRQSKPLKPSAAGREAYEHRRRVLRALEDFRTVLAPDGLVSGDFRLGLTPYISEIAMAEPFDLLRQAFPNLTLRITTGWPDLLVEQLRRGEIDVAVFYLPDGLSPPVDLDAEAMEPQSLLILAGRGLELSSSGTLHALSYHPWIVNQDGCGFRSVLKRRFEQERLPFHIGVEALSSDLRLSLVARGAGVTLATQAALESSSLHDRLDIIAVSDFDPKVRAWVVHSRPAGRLVRPIQALRESLNAA